MRRDDKGGDEEEYIHNPDRKDWLLFFRVWSTSFLQKSMYMSYLPLIIIRNFEKLLILRNGSGIVTASFGEVYFVMIMGSLA